MSIFEALILGLVQGLAEFLPISSSGHLILVRELMGITGDYLLFDIMLHIATLFAIATVFFKELLALLKPPFKTLGLIALASIPAVITGLIFAKLGIGFFENAKYLCFMFLASALIMLAAEYLGKYFAKKAENNAKLNEASTTEPKSLVHLKTAVFMGVAQALAVLPGITRSGTTICGGLASGEEREKVAKFSFFMSIPIILGSAVFELFDLGGGAQVDIWCYVVGMLAAGISGFFAISFMLKIIKKADFKWFSLYLLILAIITFFVYFLG